MDSPWRWRAVGHSPTVAAAPTGTTNATGSTLHQATGNAQITAEPGAAAQQAAQLQQPFGGDTGAPCYSTTSGAGAGPDGTENGGAPRVNSPRGQGKTPKSV
jgi:hypothetical protein